MAKALGSCVRPFFYFAVVVWIPLFVYSCGRPGSEGASSAGRGWGRGKTNPFEANAACYVCHMGFVSDDLSKRHVEVKVGCVDCHGVSAAHANDENIGATKPDVVFEHDQVDAMCLGCHDKHTLTSKGRSEQQLKRTFDKWPPVCTDCHGNHKI